MASHFSPISTRCRASFALAAALTLAGCAGSGSLAPAVSHDVPASRAGLAAGYKSLYLFRGGSDGANPFSSLTNVKGTLYGVTYGNRVGACGYGTVFSVSPQGKERALYCFKGTPDGAEPVGSLLAVGGSLYGTTFNGGAHGMGSVFQIDTSGKEHVIYSFAGGKDGTNPGAGFVELGGKLYGTTLDNGGSEQGTGTVFEVSTAGIEHVLYTFKGFPEDGETPVRFARPAKRLSVRYDARWWRASLRNRLRRRHIRPRAPALQFHGSSRRRISDREFAERPRRIVRHDLSFAGNDL